MNLYELEKYNNPRKNGSLKNNYDLNSDFSCFRQRSGTNRFNFSNFNTNSSSYKLSSRYNYKTNFSYKPPKNNLNDEFQALVNKYSNINAINLNSKFSYDFSYPNNENKHSNGLEKSKSFNNTKNLIQNGNTGNTDQSINLFNKTKKQNSSIKSNINVKQPLNQSTDTDCKNKLTKKSVSLIKTNKAILINKRYQNTIASNSKNNSKKSIIKLHNSTNNLNSPKKPFNLNKTIKPINKCFFYRNTPLENLTGIKKEKLMWRNKYFEAKNEILKSKEKIKESKQIQEEFIERIKYVKKNQNKIYDKLDDIEDGEENNDNLREKFRNSEKIRRLQLDLINNLSKKIENLKEKMRLANYHHFLVHHHYEL